VVKAGTQVIDRCLALVAECPVPGSSTHRVAGVCPERRRRRCTARRIIIVRGKMPVPVPEIWIQLG